MKYILKYFINVIVLIVWYLTLEPIYHLFNLIWHFKLKFKLIDHTVKDLKYDGIDDRYVGETYYKTMAHFFFNKGVYKKY